MKIRLCRDAQAVAELLSAVAQPPDELAEEAFGRPLNVPRCRRAIKKITKAFSIRTEKHPTEEHGRQVWYAIGKLSLARFRHWQEQQQ